MIPISFLIAVLIRTATVKLVFYLYFVSYFGSNSKKEGMEMRLGCDGTARGKEGDAAQRHLKDIIKTYDAIKSDIEARLSEFGQVWESGSERDIFLELVFCLLTPQSKARSCFRALCDITESGMVFSGAAPELADRIRNVRFRNNKSRYIVEAREMFTEDGRFVIKMRIAEREEVHALRDWLVENVKGMGYKEASHFLRNIGKGRDLAILDRHIMKNLVQLGVIDGIPGSLTPTRYREIEERMRSFSKRVGIPMDHLDLLLWYREAGEIFK